MDTPPGARIRRQEVRISLSVPIELATETGVTRNVSISGVYFECQGGYEVGDSITFALVLDHADPQGQLRVHCRGTVLRVDPAPTGIGIAVQIVDRWFDPAVRTSEGGQR